MFFTDIFIKRPVFASTLSLLIIFIGLISYTKLETRQYPKIDASVVTITVTYPGASASLMEGFVSWRLITHPSWISLMMI